MVDWEREARNNRDKITRARRAAEDLFKPTQKTTSPEFAAPASGALSTGQQVRRQPRILATRPPVAPSVKTEKPAEPKQMRRVIAPQRNTGAVPSSQVGRVRALTTYGMTRAQVAELYDVTIEEIDRIVKRPAYPAKSR